MDSLSKIVQEWLKFARQDLQAAKALYSLKDENMFRNTGFLCQQTAEKAIKAFLAHKKIKFGKIHDIKLLGEEVVKIEPQLAGLLLRAISLTPYAVEFRYPESMDRPLGSDDMLKALALAELVLQAMIDNIK